MKKRLISLLLILSMMLSMVPMLGISVGAKTAAQMTEAEAWAAGIDVYMAWFNNKTTHVEDYYNDSHFMRLYEEVFPTTDICDEKVNDAFQMIEKHFNLVSDTDALQYNIYMTLLYSCFYYYSDTSSESEKASLANYTAEQLDIINEILSMDLIQKSIDEYLDNAWASLGSGPVIENAPKILEAASTWFGSIEKASKSLNNVLTAINDGLGGVATGLQAYLSIKDAADEAAKFVNLDLLNDDFLSIILHITNDGTDPVLREAALTLYTMAVQNSNEFYKDSLVSYTAAKGAWELSLDLGLAVCQDAFLALASSSAASAGGAAASVIAGGIAAEFIGTLALGLIIANLMETTIKGLDDLFLGGTRHSRADLNMYFMEIIRTNFYIYYSKCLRDFQNNPNEYTARKLNAISKLMFNVLLCENDLAGESKRTYATAGLLNIGGDGLRIYLQSIVTRRERLTNRRNEYTSNALEAYRNFTETKVYHIRYDTTGGYFSKLNEMGFPTSDIKQYKIHSISQKIADTKPTRDGYMFIGWTTDPSASNADPTYAPGKIYTANADLTLYAVWKKANTITLNAQQGSVTPTSKTFLTGECVTLPTPSRGEGYSFLGWSTNPHANIGEYKGGKSYTFSEGDITLFAIWEVKTFNVIFDANGGVFDDVGTITEIKKPKTYNADFVFDVTEPKRDGYTFMGWSLENDNTVDWKTDDHENDIGDATANDRRVYAVWGAHEVTYDYNDGSSPVHVIVPIELNGITYHTLLQPDRDQDYVNQYFKGWMFQDPNGKYWWASNDNDLGMVSVEYPGTRFPLYGNLVLYAKWDYYIHYNDGVTYNHDIVRDGNNYVIKAPVTNGDLTFKGWQVKETGQILNVGDTIDLTSDMTLIARWAKDDVVVTYATVTYDANGGRGSVSAETVEAGTRVTLDDDSSLSRTGYEFLGWALDKNATTAKYDAGDRIRVNEDMTLYAVWTKIGSNTPSTVTMASDKEVYEPGDTVIITVNANYSDHFYLDTSKAGFTMQRMDGSTNHVGGTFVEEDSPCVGYEDNRYTNGEDYQIEVYIPDDCSDGEYEITIKVTDGIYDGDSGNTGATYFAHDEITIIVKEGGAEEPIEVNIKKSKVTMHEGDRETLKVTVSPDKYEDDIEWESSNEDVATVSSRGKITAVDIGRTTITATVNGISDTCVVVVEECDFSEQNTDIEFLKKAATCSSYAEYFYSCECGYADSVTFFDTESGYADHTFESDWSSDETHHWYVATCEHKNEVGSKGTHIDDDSNGKCDICEYSKMVESITCIISGKITSYTSSGNYTIILYDADGEEHSVMISRTSDYEFEVTPGKYTLCVSKPKHCTREYTVIVESEEITQDVKICLLGDVTGDGAIKLADYMKVKQHAQNINLLKGYALACADVTGDGNVKLADYMKIKQHAQNVNFLW